MATFNLGTATVDDADVATLKDGLRKQGDWSVFVDEGGVADPANPTNNEYRNFLRWRVQKFIDRVIRQEKREAASSSAGGPTSPVTVA